MVRVTVVSDIHYGAPGEEIYLSPLVMGIEQDQPEAVFVLGDVIHERSFYESVDNLEYVVNTLRETGIDTYFLAGNHDANVMGRDLFEVLTDTEQDQHVRVDGQEFVLVDTAFGSDSDHVAKIGDIGLMNIEMSDHDAIALSHFPLTYTDWYQESYFFETNPEAVFPVNKHYLQEMGHVPPIMLCGHMHFENGVTWCADGTWNKSIAPYSQFVEKEGVEIRQHGSYWTFDTEWLTGTHGLCDD